MTSTLLMLLLSIKAQSVSCFPSCPASCMLCSEEAVICQRLTSIIAAPQTTLVLLLTEGSISTVQPAALSDLSNITVISLSHNRISALDQNSFRNMPLLQTLLLDHNWLTLQALEGGVLTNLPLLEVLALGNNRIHTINSDLFKGTTSLRILRLEGNQITRLDSGSFPLTGLRVLESLDLSDNFIENLDKNSFRGFISLKTLDLSRNRLQSAPQEAFSYLTWLDTLNLDLNSWNCSCQLLDLVAFLSSFIQQPDKTLYNGRRMVCASADNPAVTTVLELTEANCVPSNQNITVRVDSKGSITAQLYTRDLAITGVVCFAGGVGLTLLIVLIYNKTSKKKKQRTQLNREDIKEEASSTVTPQNRNHIDVAEKRKSMENTASTAALIQQEYMSEGGGSSPKRKLRLVIPEKATNRPLTALERKIR
uniref:LRRCT domain-containing protein n=1 Tax=Knipowitschia caucasica TaxID=637954 RepID=A0AAV2JRR1_KNICA